MDSVCDAYDPLIHFDRPARFECPPSAQRARTRGVGWVMKWYVAIATLSAAACILAHFGCCLTAERTLARAARAGALEATLPRATLQSVAQSVGRRLAGYPPQLAGHLRLSLQRNGAPIRGTIEAREGDRLSVVLAVSTREVLPRWLRTICFWRAKSQIEVRAARRLPARRLADI